ncbi:MAG: Glucose-6-phosphate 3-dehydrogenase [candidate division BRC1 bacterium ADurb.BinA364]|nr:MAG: Glucose-6-phosphate 3-dehydrogenase [candidate division BRC1 bacterium ADurb.BinA364]
MKKINVGMIGYGFMGRAHSNAWRQAGNFFDLELQPELACACGRNKQAVEAFARQWGYAACATDWRELIGRKDIDLVDICVPNNLHAEIATAAAQAGKMIVCEKPLARNVAEGLKMVEAVEAAGVPNLVSFNYRRVPAVSFAKQLIDEGKLGRIFHYRANFLQDWTISPDVPQGGAGTWRLDAAAAGSGVTGDLLAHCIDAAMWHNGPIARVNAMTETFVKERVHAETGRKQSVGIDDACTFFCRFANGSIGNFESTRYARGHKALYTFEINGEHASIRWNLHDLHRLEWFDHGDPGRERGWRSIHVTDHDGSQPYMDHWWVPGLQIGFAESFVHQAADFLAAAAKGQPCSPTFREALHTQQVCEAVLESAKCSQWIDVPRAQ